MVHAIRGMVKGDGLCDRVGQSPQSEEITPDLGVAEPILSLLQDVKGTLLLAAYLDEPFEALGQLPGHDELSHIVEHAGNHGDIDRMVLAAMLAAVPAPPPAATMAWRQERATRLVHEVAGLMPADAPQARIAAEIVIAREAADGCVARTNTPGLAVEQVCRLLRIASVLLNSSAVLERTLARHQQKPAPFFGTVLAEGIDIAALAAGWGGAGSRPDGGESFSRGRGVRRRRERRRWGWPDLIPGTSARGRP